LDRNNAKLLLQPRVGLAWDPTGTGTWAVRAGFGIHNDLQDNLSIRIHANPPTNAREQFIAPLLSLIPLQKAVLPPPTCGPAVPQPCSTYTPAGVDANMFTPTIQEWSLTVEREITKNTMLQLSYVGSQSYHTNVTQNVPSASSTSSTRATAINCRWETDSDSRAAPPGWRTSWSEAGSGMGSSPLRAGSPSRLWLARTFPGPVTP